MPDALQEITIFARIVGAGSLSAAARDLGMSPALVSRRLASLEGRLGVRLVNRTTRGVLRVALPASFGNRHVAPLVPRFAERYPDVQIALSLSDRTVNVVEEGFDLAIRIAELADSSLAARKLAPNRRVVCASPAYLQRHGTPRTPEDLAKHNCLATDFTMNWDYRGPDGK